MSDNEIVNEPKANKKLDVWAPLILSMTMIGGIFVGMRLQAEPLINTSTKKNESKSAVEKIVGDGTMEEILRYVDAKYVDDVNNQLLTEKAINNLMLELDPHSIYIPASELAHVNEDLEGEYEGVGIEALVLEDTATVITPLENSPAANSGVLSGDKILAIGDSTAIGRDMRWLNGKLRGKRGSTVKLTILRGGEYKPKIITITRDKVPVHSVDAAVALDDKTGYVKITRFSANTSREFMQGLEKLFEKKGIKNLVIDLRGNPGGYLDKAVDVLSQIFKDKDKLLVYTKGRTVHRNEYKTSGRQRYDVEKVAILIDEGSASASEIVAGAVQDWDRGVIVGRRSFGKGLVQEPYTLRDGSELRLTVARYFTPTGRSIQKPYRNKTRQEYANEDNDRFQRGELTFPDSIYIDDKSRYTTAAGRTVYGGGGIVPDVFVPIEDFVRNDYYQKLRIWANDYAYLYLNRHRSELEKFREWQQFQRGFRLPESAFNEFMRYAERHDVPREYNQMSAVKEPIRRLIKARIARQLYGDEGYFGILSQEDPCIMRALESFQQDDPLNLKKIVYKKTQ